MTNGKTYLDPGLLTVPGHLMVMTDAKLTMADALAQADAYGAMVRARDGLVWQWRVAGVTKAEIHRRTGIARSTLDRILDQTL
jgi:hypothetical protein